MNDRPYVDSRSYHEYTLFFRVVTAQSRQDLPQQLKTKSIRRLPCPNCVTCCIFFVFVDTTAQPNRLFEGTRNHRIYALLERQIYLFIHFYIPGRCFIYRDMYYYGNDYYCDLSELRSFENLRPTVQVDIFLRQYSARRITSPRPTDSRQRPSYGNIPLGE